MPHIALTGLSASLALHNFMYPPMPPRAPHSSPQPAVPPGRNTPAPRPSQAAGLPLSAALSASRPPAAVSLTATAPVPLRTTPHAPPPAAPAPTGSVAGLPAVKHAAPPSSQPLDLTGSAHQPPLLSTPGKHGVRSEPAKVTPPAPLPGSLEAIRRQAVPAGAAHLASGKPPSSVPASGQGSGSPGQHAPQGPSSGPVRGGSHLAGAAGQQLHRHAAGAVPREQFWAPASAGLPASQHAAPAQAGRQGVFHTGPL